MIKKFMITFGLAFALICDFTDAHPVQAAAVSYQTLTYGTTKTSLAAKYYVQPAQVVVNGDDYLVTMTIHTTASLGAWPVTVLSINGVGPANVVKTHDNNGYDYQYAFETKDLSQTINSDIAINVVGVYAAQHTLSFKFDQKQLPSLQKTSPTQTPAKKNIPVTRAPNDQAKQVAKLNAANQATQTKVLIGGGLSMVIVAIGAGLWVRRKQPKS